MKILKLFLIIPIFVFASDYLYSGSWNEVHYDSIEPQSSSWENEYLQRRELILTSKSWNSRSNRGDEDNGKRYWPLLMADMYTHRDDQSAIDSLIEDSDNGGNSGIYGYYEGSWYKPFSAPGYCFYYFTYYDRITEVDPDQHNKVESMWDYPNRNYASRPDGKMDPIYECTEFNSENYDWMARTGGYLMSHFFNDETIIDDGNKPAMDYFSDWVDNWVRGTYCAGRIEWESHIYFPFCFQAAASVYEFADYVADDQKKVRQGRAVMDYMTIEAALHWLDGMMVGPESRNKESGYERWSGSGRTYYYLYFTDSEHRVTNSTEASLQDEFEHDLHTAGFIANMNYRPPKAAIDIAQRKFDAPVEIHSAKPYYRLDWNNYRDWRGDSYNSRKFEFETMYLHDNYTLASVATQRPAAQGPFVEFCVWRLGVKGLPLQVFGNTDPVYDISGRSPYEEVAQYRNVMMRMMKGEDKMWVAVPDTIINAPEWDGNKLFANLGNDVYMAIIPYNSTDHADNEYNPKQNPYKKYKWNFNASNLNALILEVGTAEEHGSFSNFKSQIKNNTNISASGDQIEYTSTLNNKLKMEWVPTTTYTYTPNSKYGCYESTIDPAGTLPKVWYDGQENDYDTWNNYEVVYGDKIIDSKWGDGTLEIKSNKNHIKIQVDTSTADVSYYKMKGPVNQKKQSSINPSKDALEVQPNPAKNDVNIKCKAPSDGSVEINMYNITGKKINTIFKGALKKNQEYRFDLDVSGKSPGVYFLKYLGTHSTHTKKLVIK